MTLVDLERHLVELRDSERIKGYVAAEHTGVVLIGLQLSCWALLTPWRFWTVARGLELDLEPLRPPYVLLRARARLSADRALAAAAAAAHRDWEPCPGCPLCCDDCAAATGGQCRRHQEAECSCYELIGGHQPGCAFHGWRGELDS